VKAILLFSLVAMTTPTPPAPAPAASPDSASVAVAGEDRAASELTRLAREAMAGGRFEEAIGRYDELRRRQPRVAQIPFNQGVAAYRGGDLDGATEFFRDAMSIAEDPMLRARAAYNLGTTAYAKALNQQTAPQAVTEEAASATEELQRAIDQYRDVLDTSPDDADALANAELAQRFLTRLEEMQEQQQDQQQSQDPDQSESEDGESEPSESEPGEESEDGEQGEDAQPRPQPGEEGERPESDPSQAGDEEQPEETPPEPAPTEDESDEGEAGAEEQDQPQDESENEDSDASDGEGAEEEREGRMSRTEAERLLQGVRDRERQRREELRQRESGRLAPVDKDW